MKMKEYTREKGFYYGIRQYRDAKNELVKIIKDLLVVPSKVYIENDIIYIIFDDDCNGAFHIAFTLHIDESCVNHISVLTNIPYHYAVPLELLEVEL